MTPRPSSQGRFVRKTAPRPFTTSNPSLPRLTFLHGPLSRRRFFKTSAGLGGIALVAGQRTANAAHGNGDPKPIPQGLQVFAPADLTVFHVLAPGYPGFGMDPATNDASVITDFNGTIGLTYVAGMGTHTNKATNTVRRLPFEVDMRFMEGTYIAVDGKPRHRTFAFV